jgi:hypothetical protein
MCSQKLLVNTSLAKTNFMTGTKKNDVKVEMTNALCTKFQNTSVATKFSDVEDTPQRAAVCSLFLCSQKEEYGLASRKVSADGKGEVIVEELRCRQNNQNNDHMRLREYLRKMFKEYNSIDTEPPILAEGVVRYTDHNTIAGLLLDGENAIIDDDDGYLKRYANYLDKKVAKQDSVDALQFASAYTLVLQTKCTKNFMGALLRLEGVNETAVHANKTSTILRMENVFPTLVEFQEAVSRHGITSYNCNAKLIELKHAAKAQPT